MHLYFQFQPKYVLVVLLEDTKLSKTMYIRIVTKQDPTKELHLIQLLTSVEIAGKIIDKIGPILATKY